VKHGRLRLICHSARESTGVGIGWKDIGGTLEESDRRLDRIACKRWRAFR
jgi:hypothetical protein